MLKFRALPQRVYVDDSLSASLFVSFTESSHIIQCAIASVRGTALVLITVDMAGCCPREKKNRQKVLRLIPLYFKIQYAPKMFFSRNVLS